MQPFGAMSARTKAFWQSDVSPAAWLADALGPWCQSITSVVPGGFSSYARILHAAGGEEPPGGERRSWASIARENGRVPHSTMQFHNICRPRGSPSGNPGEMPSVGALPPPERRLLAELLATETTTPDHCWFCIWEGWGSLDDQGVHARVDLPNRSYLLHTGPVFAALVVPPQQLGAHARFTPVGHSAPAPAARQDRERREEAERVPALPWSQGPALWWPQDRAWVVATEIDFGWTYVGASEQVVQRLLTHPGLEAWRAQPGDPFTADGDTVNAALDTPATRKS